MNLFTLNGRLKQVSFCLFLLLISFVTNAQLPIAYYDFESNAARNTTLETTVEATASGIGTPSFSTTGALTQVLNSNSGNGTNAAYGGGANAGYALGYFGFSTAVSPASTAASIDFGPFNTTGLSTITLTYDVIGIGAKAPQNARVYYSINGGTNWISATTTTGAGVTVTTSYTTNIVVLPAGAANAAALLIKIVGYNAQASPTSTDGVMMVDNLTLRAVGFGIVATPITTTLISSAVHGAGLSSGGSFVPEYTSVTLTNASTAVTANSNLILNGTVTLTSGVFNIANNTLTFQNGAVQPIARNGTSQTGTITLGASANLVFGATTLVTTTLPAAIFTTPPITFANLTINRGVGNNINFGDNDIELTGNLTVNSGTFTVNNAGGSLVVNGDVDVNNSTFTSSTTGLVTMRGNLNLNAGSIKITVATGIIEVQGNITGTGTQVLTGNGKISMTGVSKTLSSGVVYDNVEVNTGAGNDISFVGGGTVLVTGLITLTSGNLAVGNHTLQLTTVASNIVKTAGFIKLATTTNLILGDGINATFVLPANSFDPAASTFANLTVQRGASSTTWGNNPVTITGNVVVNSPFIINVATGTLAVGGGITVNTSTLTVNAASGVVTVAGSINLLSTSTLTVSGAGAMVTVTGNLNVNSSTLTVSGAAAAVNVVADLALTSGTVSTTSGTSNVNVQGNVTGTGSQTVASTGKIVMLGSGTTLSSGVTYDNVEVNSAGNVSLTGNTTFTGITTLTAGNLVFGANTVTYNSGASQIAKTSGFITLNAGTNLVFGFATANSALPDNCFNGSTSIASLVVKRAEAGAGAARFLRWANNPITVTGNLDIISDAFSTTLLVDNTSGTITVNGNLNFSSSGVGVSTLSTTTGSVIVNGSVVLISGTANQVGTGKLVMTGNAGVASLAGLAYSTVELNSANNFSLAGSASFSGILTLTSGELAVGANTLTFHTNNTPIIRTSGTINLSTSSSLAFGETGLTGGSNFVIPANVFTPASPEFANFTINRTNNLTLNAQNFALTGVLTITSGRLILPAAYLFTLRSTSITNTAMVGVVGTSGFINYGAGAAFRVERFIPQTGGTGRRAYRDIAPSVNTGTGTIFANWQEGGTSGLVSGIYYGTHITGKAGASPGGVDATTGLDISQTGSKSLNTYDENLPTAWNTVNTTNQTNDTLSAFKGYRILIRGDRRVNLYGPSVNTMNAPTTLRNTGKLVTGDVVFNTTGVTANGTTNTGIRMSPISGGYTLIGNPYAAPVDWHILSAAATGIEPTYWLYDANVGTIGGYVTYNAFTGSNTNTTGVGSSAANRYIQPGQAIFTVNTSTTPSVTFSESYKAVNTANLTNTFRTNNTDVENLSKLYINFKKAVSGSGNVVMDGAAIAYNATFSNLIDKEDGKKFENSNENICILSNGQEISVEGRVAATINDTVKLRVWRVTAGVNYQLEVDAAKFVPNGLQAYLVDNFTNAQTTLSMIGTTTYSFVTTSNAASFGNRFNIVFKPAAALPVSFTSIKAYQQNAGINVDWAVAETNIVKYEILGSADGQQFATLGTTVAKGNGSSSIQNYTWFDAVPKNGNNFYRIRSTDNNGNIAYSAIVLVKLSNKNVNIVVYPNPVKDKTVNMQFNNIVKGDYTIAIYNTNGQTVYTATFKHNGGTAAQSFLLPQNISAGFYRLSIKGKEYSNEQNLLVD